MRELAIKRAQDPPNTTAFRTGEETVLLGVTYNIVFYNYNLRKAYLGLENEGRYWGEAVNGEAVLGGGGGMRLTERQYGGGGMRLTERQYTDLFPMIIEGQPQRDFINYQPWSMCTSLP